MKVDRVGAFILGMACGVIMWLLTQVFMAVCVSPWLRGGDWCGP